MSEYKLPANKIAWIVTITTVVVLVTGALAADSELLRGQVSSPRFAPGYRHIIAYERQVKDVQQLFVYNWESGEVDQVTTGDKVALRSDAVESSLEFEEPTQFSRFDGQLDWRPVLDYRGWQWFAFVSSGDDKEYDIYLSHIDKDGRLGDKPIRLKWEGPQQYPRWSPDGDHLAFVGKGKGESDIYVAVKVGDIIRGKGADSFRPVQMTSNPGQDIFPAWSPDSRYIAYQATLPEKGSTNSGINLVDFSLYLQTRKIPQPLRLSHELPLNHEYKPSWSPDGKYIAYYLSQGELGSGAVNRKQDIGILSLVNDPSGKVVGGRVKSGSSTRLETNVLSNRDTGPSWLTGGGSTIQTIFYVYIDEQANPIKQVDLNCWLSNKFNCKAEVSQSFGTQLHRDVAVMPLPDATIALAFVSQEGNTNRLNVRPIPVSNIAQRAGESREIVIYQEKSSKTAMIRSLVFPGLGQRYKGQSLKANIFTGSEVLALAGWLLMSSKFDGHMKDYDAAEAEYMAATTKTAADESFAKWQSSYDGAVSSINGTRIAAGIAVALWAYNLWDARSGFPLRLPLQVRSTGPDVQIAPPQLQVKVHNGQPAFGVGLALQF